MIEQQQKHYIDGQWVAGAGDELDVINPATMQKIASIAIADSIEVDAAVRAARAAFDSFSQTDIATRKALLAAIAEEYDRRRSDIGNAIMQELGAPIDLAQGGQSGTGASHLRNFQVAIDEVEFLENLPNGDQVMRTPVGVVALITPWNWPIHQICLKVLAALAAGCTIVLKPSEETPLNALLFAEVLHDAGVPKGVFNLVNGNGAVTGAALTHHPDVDLISFTGSGKVGAQIAASAGAGLKRVALELGGKSPCLVFDDADPEVAIRAVLNKLFPNSGQNCNAPTRLLVARNSYEKICTLATQIADEWQVGDPAQHGNHIGPVANQRQFDHVQSIIASAQEEGARLLAGGVGRPEGLDVGCFVRPTIFADVTTEMRIFSDEVFGPVLAITPFDSEEEALELANHSDYGLAAYIFSQDAQRIERLNRQLRAGMIFANGADLGPGSPFGGMKKSGYGREGGRYGIEEFLDIILLAQ